MVVIKNYNVIFSSKIKDKGEMKEMYKNRMDLLMFGSTGIFFFPLWLSLVKNEIPFNRQSLEELIIKILRSSVENCNIITDFKFVP